MTIRLFDEIKRTDTGPSRHSETHYTYLNRSARPEAERIRSLLADWFSRYPKKQNDFLLRFKDKEHDSTFFELYLHEILFQQSFKCEVHPNLSTVKKHPEFLVYHKGKPCFYLEATVAYSSHSAVYDKFLSELEKIQSDFYFRVHGEGRLATSPPLRDFKKWLKSINSDGLQEQKHTIKHDKAEITITLVPKAKAQSDRMLNVYPSWFGLCETIDLIRKAIHKKATAYGELDLPFLLAINVIDKVFWIPIRPEEVQDAMFGQRVVIFRKGSPETTHTRNYKSAKLLSPQGNPQNTRVSGIIIVGCLNPWNFNGIIPELWHNPWAEYPFPSELWQLPQQIPNKSEGVYEKKDGKTISDLLSLPPNWPQEDRNHR